MSGLFKGHCTACLDEINQFATGDPYLPYKYLNLCSSCYIGLINPIYTMSGAGDGGIINLAFQIMLTTKHNRKNRISLRQYKITFKKLLHKYNFCCAECCTDKKLTIDHIKPVSKGGGDEITNLQILCKSCNSRKGAKYEMV